MKSSDPYENRRFNLPLALTLGGMITLGITTTALGLLLWPDPKEHHDTSLEGWPERAAPAPDAAPESGTNEPDPSP